MSAERPPEVEALVEYLHFYTCYEKYAHYDGVKKCETAAGHLQSHWLADHDARVRAEALRGFANSIVTPGPDDDGPTLYAVWCAANDRADDLESGL